MSAPDTVPTLAFTDLNASSRSLPSAPPVSLTDQKFIEQAVRNIEVKKKVSLSGSSPNLSDLSKKERRKLSLRKAMQEKRMEVQEGDDQHGKIKDKVLCDVEKELWDSGDWRDQIKDLNSSFSKLPPISKGKKVVEGKGQAFII